LSSIVADTAGVRWALDDWLKREIAAGHTEFRPVAVACAINAPVHLVFSEMMKLVRAKKLSLVWHGVCLGCGEDAPLPADGGLFCSKCRVLFKATPVFFASPDYVAYVRSGSFPQVNREGGNG